MGNKISDDWKTIKVSLPPKVEEKLRQCAKQQTLSRNAFARLLIIQSLGIKLEISRDLLSTTDVNQRVINSGTVTEIFPDWLVDKADEYVHLHKGEKIDVTD
ncbi:hypothetical protein [Desulforamulus aquiferis]|uniref:Ribbon-helix-helix protein CopG domain-containing protein n=1 Tax=Desulforamulus aquiferis TaxID=1397668 RepID=A0AAW7Z947_9FIRM|nr:hypothetical protein [Desulforamulus aquiferis]MDO7785818.1 hypothetical protein [Desulforamulus aquiferis]